MQRTKSGHFLVAMMGACQPLVLKTGGGLRWAYKPYGAYALYSARPQYHSVFEKTVSIGLTSLKSGYAVPIFALNPCLHDQLLTVRESAVFTSGGQQRQT